ncbi:unnamed protein product [Closterium sp. Naga37s-1]|nr:unnamed protein product [Closterium sp. Naga37s-1]
MAGSDAEASSTVDRGRSSGSMRLPPLDAPAAAGAAAGSGGMGMGMGMDRPSAAGAGGGGSLLERTSGASGSGGALLSRLFRTSSALNPSESVKRLLMWPRAGSQLFRCSPSARAATNCWSPADPSLLLVRGPSYASDGAKAAHAAPPLYEPWAPDVFHTSPVLPPQTPPVYPCSDGAKVAPAAPPMYEPWAADVFHTSRKIRHIAAHVDLPAALVPPPGSEPATQSSNGLPPVLIVNIQNLWFLSPITGFSSVSPAPLPPPSTTPLYHPPLPTPSATPLCHPPLPPPSATPLWHPPLAPPSGTPLWHPSLPPPSATPLCHPPLPPLSASPAHPPAAPAAAPATALAAAAGVGWAGPECGAVLSPGGALAHSGKRSCTDGGTWACGYGGVRLWGPCVRRAGLGLSVMLYCRLGAHWRGEAMPPVQMQVCGPECGAMVSLLPGGALACPDRGSLCTQSLSPHHLASAAAPVLLPAHPHCTACLSAACAACVGSKARPREARRSASGGRRRGGRKRGREQFPSRSSCRDRGAGETAEQQHGTAGTAAEDAEAAGEGAAGREAERSVPHVEGNSGGSSGIKTRRSNSGRRRGSWSSYSSADDTAVGGEVAAQGHEGKGHGGKDHGGKEHVRREHGGKSERWSRSGGEDGEREGRVEKVVWDRPKLMVRLVNEGEVALGAAGKKVVEGCSGRAVLTRRYHTVLQVRSVLLCESYLIQPTSPLLSPPRPVVRPALPGAGPSCPSYHLNPSSPFPPCYSPPFSPISPPFPPVVHPAIPAAGHRRTFLPPFPIISTPPSPSRPPSPPLPQSSAQPYMELDIDAHAFPPAHQRALLSLRPHLPDAILDLALVLQVEAQAQQVGERVGGARAPRGENVAGDFYVDHTCINCDVCRWMAPEVFAKVGSQSAVFAQPGDEATAVKALQALLSCPTASIHSRDSLSLVPRARDAFPLPIDAAALPGVFHCGYHSRKSFGAASYFIQRAAGNVMVDCPRYSEHLAETLARMGGVRYIVLTHRDDVADHARWAARFKAERVLHALEVQPDTTDVEMPLDGTGPWCLGSDLKIIFTPGHTEGSVSVLYKAHGGALFSGDHLAYAPNTESLSIMRRVNWYSVPVQVQSTKKLVGLPFRWLLPGHGRRFHFESEEERDAMLQHVVAGEEALLLRGH